MFYLAKDISYKKFALRYFVELRLVNSLYLLARQQMVREVEEVFLVCLQFSHLVALRLRRRGIGGLFRQSAQLAIRRTILSQQSGIIGTVVSPEIQHATVEGVVELGMQDNLLVQSLDSRRELRTNRRTHAERGSHQEQRERHSCAFHQDEAAPH
ncbi:MAG TPA: hypothetical protein VND42_04745 [Candidatus Acidoferrales bacterium]|nr:hypothetical protein [Candidatus Acidoferrales bacterium]